MPHNPRTCRRRGLSLGLALLALLTFHVRAETAAPEPSAQPASVIVESREWPLWFTVDGRVEAVNQGTVSAQVTARVLRWHVDVDDVVTRDALLVELEDNELRARLQQAEAQHTEAVARAEEARRQFERIQQLYAQKTVSKAQFDNAEASLKAAEARRGVTEAASSEARRQLAYTRVTAPYAGIVTARHREIGELATAGTPLISGFSLDQVRVTGWLPQSVAASARRSDEARVRVPEEAGPIASRSVPAAPALPVTALLIYPYADPETRQFRFRADLPSENTPLLPGTWVKTDLRIGTTSALAIPASALIQRHELQAVYVMDASGQAHLRPVRRGLERDGQIEILGGLSAGERVATDPAAIAATQRH